MMTEYLTEHWILSIFITVLLGAIGSGLWDTVLKPLGTKIDNVLFTAMTLGARRSRDKIYKNAAMGHHELPSLYLLLMALLLLASLVAGSQVRLYALVYALDVVETFASECINLEGKEAKACALNVVKEKIMPVLQIASLFALFVSIIIIYRFIAATACVEYRTLASGASSNYTAVSHASGYRYIAINRTNLVTTYYQQCLRVVRPYMDDKQFFEIEQRYELIVSKEDYDSIISKLREVAKQGGS
jgi:hypothetical protein